MTLFPSDSGAFDAVEAAAGHVFRCDAKGSAGGAALKSTESRPPQKPVAGEAAAPLFASP